MNEWSVYEYECNSCNPIVENDIYLLVKSTSVYNQFYSVGSTGWHIDG